MKYLTHALLGKSLEYFGMTFKMSFNVVSGQFLIKSTASFAFMIFPFRQFCLFFRHVSRNLQPFQLFDSFETGGFRIFETSGRLWLLPYPPLIY